jgi:hypothetical protein
VSELVLTAIEHPQVALRGVAAQLGNLVIGVLLQVATANIAEAGAASA